MTTSKNNQQKKTTSNLRLYIFERIKEGLRPSKICKELGIKDNALQYHLSLLKQSGFIKKIGYGVWEICKDYDQKELQKTTKIGQDNPHNNLKFFKQDTVRAHAFQFTLRLPKNLMNWDKRREILKKQGIKFKPLKIFGDGESLTFKGRKVWLTNKSIIIFEKSNYMAESSKEAKKYAIYDFLQLVRSLERHMKANFNLVGDNVKFKVSRQHYALIKNALAKQYDKEGKKLEIYNEQGLWFLIDNSFNLHESETVHPKTSDKDNERVLGFFNGLKKQEGYTPQFVLEAMGGIQENQLIFAKNMESHIKAIQDLGKGVKKNNEIMKKMFEFFKKREQKDI